LLLNPGRFAWAVNSIREDDELRIGGLYLEPNIPDPNLRFTHSDGFIDVELPEEFVGQQEALRAWNISLKIRSHP
tara:strand:+ start:37 stop:261 length:225 start_codon:yes stop_codon:yes gene_type:complete